MGILAQQVVTVDDDEIAPATERYGCDQTRRDRTLRPMQSLFTIVACRKKKTRSRFLKESFAHIGTLC